jgi:hypothetical protein
MKYKTALWDSYSQDSVQNVVSSVVFFITAADVFANCNSSKNSYSKLYLLRYLKQRTLQKHMYTSQMGKHQNLTQMYIDFVLVTIHIA